MGPNLYALFIKWLEGHVVRSTVGKNMPKIYSGIHLLDVDDTEMQSDTLYLSTPQQLKAFLKNGAVSANGAIVITTASEQFDISLLPKQLTLIETSLQLIPLYNLLQTKTEQFRIWKKRLHRVVYMGDELQKMLDIAAEMIPYSIFIVNPGFKHIASVYNPAVKDVSADELRENGYQQFETIQRIRNEKSISVADDGSWCEYISSESGNLTIVNLIHCGQNLAARFVTILNGPDENGWCFYLCMVVANYISEYITSHQGAIYSSNAAFGALVADLIECRLTNGAELEQRMKQIQLSVRRYYHVAIVQVDEKNKRESVPWNYIISQLERIVPFCNITTYRKDIIMIIRKTQRASRLKIDIKHLMPLLEQYNCYMGIGNASEFLTSLPPVYHQVYDTLRIGRKMSPEKRIFYFEDYSMYEVVEMAMESAQHQLFSRNLAHLCCNDFIALLIYDQRNRSNLIEIMHIYLQNERNSTETAKVLFLHRNTLLNKIHKIEEIIGSSLDDVVLRERLLFSYRVMQYANKYNDEDLLTLKLTPTTNTNTQQAED